MGATELETHIQGYRVEAHDRNYVSLPLHVPSGGRRRQWRWFKPWPRKKHNGGLCFGKIEVSPMKRGCQGPKEVAMATIMTKSGLAYNNPPSIWSLAERDAMGEGLNLTVKLAIAVSGDRAHEKWRLLG